ncbi:MAG TPA: rhodanese-like domain-containing protein [Nocardioidaceae bacterium]|jgi:rhodanese-related sulfurtransferase|nr:rhodanese-like domain-containing protein [Nocardioidaceae bacterium]
MSTPSQQAYRDVEPLQALAALEEGAVLVDVREPAEWDAGHVPSARHIPLAQLAARSAELPVTRPLVVICRSGNRSAFAARMLATAHPDVSNVSGGMRAWAEVGLPVVARGGGQGFVA